MNEFFLSTEVAIRVNPVDGAPARRWMQIPHTGVVLPALVLLAGERAELADGLAPESATRLHLRFSAAHGELSADGATLTLSLVTDQGALRLAEFDIAPGIVGMRPREAMVDLSAFAGMRGCLQLAVGAGPAGDPLGDWVAIHELTIATEEDLPAVRARAFNGERTRNELAHFAHVYEHRAYDTGKSRVADAVTTCRTLAQLQASVRAEKAAVVESPAAATPAFPSPHELTPVPGDAYHYAHRLLNGALRARAPNFPARLRDIARQRAPRVLSLCSGAARIEASFAEAVPEAQWTLMDLNEPLLQSAAANFPEGVVPELIVADLNEVAAFGERYDVILCVSGLHHIVELERVVGFIHDALAEDGEFWSIGEAIGRNGNRLWSSDHAVANAFFHSLPSRLRRNRGSGEVDDDLPNVDYSGATFEGIRSQDIEPLLARMLDPVDVYRRNCFLWRLVDLAYADNYDLGDADDIGWLQRAVAAELAHFRQGGRATELHGVFRRRRF